MSQIKNFVSSLILAATGTLVLWFTVPFFFPLTYFSYTVERTPIPSVPAAFVLSLQENFSFVMFIFVTFIVLLYSTPQKDQ